ncbi:MAG: hypothetical protein ABI746_08200 [Dermatophilaceae bacterium]
MENNVGFPTPDEAAAAIAQAKASRADLAGRLVLPRVFYSSIGAAVTLQIASAAVGLSEDSSRTPMLLVAGLAVFAVTAGVQLMRFRRLNGVWIAGLASRLVLGTGTAASTSYALALAASIWAGFAEMWWLVVLCSSAGGLAYALSGRQWLRRYHGDPARHARAESAAWLAVMIVLALAGLVLLVASR